MRISQRLSTAVLIAAAAVVSTVSPALAHKSVRGAVLLPSEVPSYFDVHPTHFYSGPTIFLKASYKKLGRTITLSCASPNLNKVTFQQGMIQLFENSKSGLQDMKVCSWLYANSAKAHTAYGLESSVAGGLFFAGMFKAKKVRSHIANESVLYEAKEFDGAVFRSDNAVVFYYYADFGGLHMSNSSFLGLAGKLIARLG